MERLDPAVEHLREPGDGGDIGDRQPCLAQRPRRAAGRDQLESARDQAAAEVHEAGLVRNGQEGPARRRGRRRPPGRRRCVTRRPSTLDGAGQEQADRPRAGVDARRPGSGRAGSLTSSSGRIATRLLGDDRAAVEGRVDQVDRASGHGRAVGQRVRHRVAARERRAAGWVRVEDAPAVGREDAPAR